MAIPKHNRRGFFKYYTAKAATITLESGSRKWSSPLLFNDPFDNQFGLDFPDPTKELSEEGTRRFLEILLSRDPLKPNQLGNLTPTVALARQILRANPGFEFSDEDIAYLQGGVLKGMENVRRIAPETSAEIHRVMADTTVFCVSETNDNILMWSHYAGNHAGVVVEFLALAEVDSPLLLARPVRYSREMPRLSYDILTDSEKGREAILDTITLSKSDVWAYEREWRVWATLRDKSCTYEIISYAAEEIGSVYLGCQIIDDTKKEILEIVRKQYPKAKAYQAVKHNSKFELLFREIT